MRPALFIFRMIPGLVSCMSPLEDTIFFSSYQGLFLMRLSTASPAVISTLFQAGSVKTHKATNPPLPFAAAINRTKRHQAPFNVINDSDNFSPHLELNRPLLRYRVQSLYFRPSADKTHHEPSSHESFSQAPCRHQKPAKGPSQQSPSGNVLSPAPQIF
ncbi:hypothetical protein ACQKWADRAFT_291804 [Trichoderma austrokoningii]